MRLEEINEISKKIVELENCFLQMEDLIVELLGCTSYQKEIEPAIVSILHKIAILARMEKRKRLKK